MDLFTFERIYSVAIDQSNLMNAIADKDYDQKTAASMYADLIRADTQARQRGGELPDWKAVNAAILNRWPKGLERIKKMAWKEIEAK